MTDPDQQHDNALPIADPESPGGNPTSSEVPAQPYAEPAGAGELPDTSGRSSASGPSTDARARLAHELKTPLSAIAAAAEIMRDERLGAIGNERYKEYAADIYSGARHALSIIERMLVPRGAEAGENSGLSFAPADLNAIAQSCASMMLPLAGKAGLRLGCELEPDLPRFTADAVSLKQIILNLITNSVKFSARGDEVILRTKLTRKGSIGLEVLDTGRGMTKSEIAAALGAIRPLSVSLNASGGLGMGLSLVRSLVEENGGTLNIESTPGAGTKVMIDFPRRRMIAV